METVKLSRIVAELTPELFPFLKKTELDSDIILRYGFGSLDPEDAAEIVKLSISEHQKDAFFTVGFLYGFLL